MPYCVRLLTKDGRTKVMQDPKGQWVPTRVRVPTPKPAAADAAAMSVSKAIASVAPPIASGGLGSLLGSKDFLATDGKTRVSLSEVAKDAPLIALYFSAHWSCHWCGPCRSFTPKLITFVEMLREDGIELPVVFGSSDRDAAAFDEYFATMPWCAFPHGDPRPPHCPLSGGAQEQVPGGRHPVAGGASLDARGNLVVCFRLVTTSRTTSIDCAQPNRTNHKAQWNAPFVIVSAVTVPTNTLSMSPALSRGISIRSSPPRAWSAPP